MQVEAAPQGDEQRPRLLFVSLRAHPLLLFIAGEDQVVRELRADETLVVVRGRVNQVAQYPLRRPLALGPRLPALVLRDREQTRRRLLDRPPEVFDKVFPDSTSTFVL